MHEINDQLPEVRKGSSSWVMPALVACLAGATIWSMVALSGERKRVGDLSTENQQLTTNLNEMRNQVKLVSDQLSSLNTRVLAQKEQEAAAEAQRDNAAEPAREGTPQRTKAAAARRAVRPAVQPRDPRVDQLQARVGQQEKELAAAREKLDKTREELEGNINSAKDELSGSITRTNDTVARNHEELVELQKRGQRNYYEFTLDKSKNFQRVGPISLSLRKANTKKRSYDFEMMVDDQKLQKKNVNLFEPVVISTPDRGQPLQLVVNEVRKDVVRGYVSEPKFKIPQLTATTTTASNAPALQQRQ